jgi:uncharacterized coiled-coil protein SlyX
MADVTWPSISSAADETIAKLDALFAAQRARREKASIELAALTARLGDSTEPWAEPSMPPTSPLGAPSSRSSERRGHEPMPFVPLPERTSHGGGFGPRVRNKLIAEALAEGDRW